MNKNMDKEKSEPQILLEKNSTCLVFLHHVFKRLLSLKGLNVALKDQYTMPVFCFIKSPDLDDDKE